MTDEEIIKRLEEIRELVIILQRIRDRGQKEKFRNIVRKQRYYDKKRRIKDTCPESIEG